MLSLKKVRKNIYLLNFDSAYDAAMYFMRYQEYYESSETKGQNLPMVDLMEIYSNKYGDGEFSYAGDWVGFNIPGSIIFDLHNDGIKDMNRYDLFMISIAESIRLKCNDDFYLIGTSNKHKGSYSHELAHGLFYTNSQYRAKMTKLFEELPAKIRNHITKCLLESSYHESVHIDETQAYMATGITAKMQKKKSINKYRKEYKDIFKKYAGNIAIKN